jgi:hypothetical protein
MEKETLKVRVLDLETKQVLFECPIAEAGKAYAFAATMEQMGLSIEVVNPTLAQTLSNSLGLSNTEVAAYEQSLEEEMDQHEGSCCFEEDVNTFKH